MYIVNRDRIMIKNVSFEEVVELYSMLVSSYGSGRLQYIWTLGKKKVDKSITAFVNLFCGGLS